MRTGIGLKLFVALLAAGILMAAAMGLASRISFQRGFLGYLNELETQRLAALSASLADLYREASRGQAGGAWSFLAGREDEWRRVLRSSDRAFRASREAGEAGERAARLERWPASPGPGERPPPAREPGGPPPPEPGGSSAPAEPGGRTSLLDAERRIIAGNRRPAPDAVYSQVVVDGQTVGWVASTPFRELTDAADLSFQRQQGTTAWFIAALAVLLAGAAAWGLGRIVLAPARQLAAATHRLAAGHYETRVTIDSDDELGRLGEDFNRLADTLARNERLRRDFMADVSHELRTPLAVMRGELEAIEDGLLPMDRRSVASLQSEVATLTKLVEDIHTLAVADVGSLSYDRQIIDVDELLSGVADGFQDRALAHGLVLELQQAGGAHDGPRHGGPQIRGDRQRLQQVLGNVLENAARYSGGEAGRPVPVRLSARAEGAQIVIDIEDGGPGVPDAVRDRLFERFFRAESSRNRATGGSGLGLAICRSLVAAHGGEISADRSALGGLRIRIRLPGHRPAAGEARSA